MRQDTIDRIRERIELAQKRHGEFEHKAQVLDAIQLEIAETRYAFDWQDSDRFVAELLDVATVAIRGTEQFDDAETEADATKPMMPDNLWIPALRVSDKGNGTFFSQHGSNSFNLRQVNSNRGDISWFMDADDARAIRDWLNQFIAASEAEQ